LVVGNLFLTLGMKSGQPDLGFSPVAMLRASRTEPRIPDARRPRGGSRHWSRL